MTFGWKKGGDLISLDMNSGLYRKDQEIMYHQNEILKSSSIRKWDFIVPIIDINLIISYSVPGSPRKKEITLIYIF